MPYWHFYWWSLWWLIFPIMGFVFGAFGMWMSYKRQRDTMELMKTYAAQGKDPQEIAKAMSHVDPMAGAGPYGPSWGWGWGWSRWGWRGPYWEWRRFIVFTCLSVGFAVAAWYTDDFGASHAFTIVAIIMGVLAAGSFLFAVLASFMARPPRIDGK